MTYDSFLDYLDDSEFNKGEYLNIEEAKARIKHLIAKAAEKATLGKKVGLQNTLEGWAGKNQTSAAKDWWSEDSPNSKVHNIYTNIALEKSNVVNEISEATGFDAENVVISQRFPQETINELERLKKDKLVVERERIENEIKDKELEELDEIRIPEKETELIKKRDEVVKRKVIRIKAVTSKIESVGRVESYIRSLRRTKQTPEVALTIEKLKTREVQLSGGVKAFSVDVRRRITDAQTAEELDVIEREFEQRVPDIIDAVGAKQGPIAVSFTRSRIKARREEL